jgi:hypothetical protein
MTTILQALLEDACQDGPYYDGVLGIDRTLMRRINWHVSSSEPIIVGLRKTSM